MMDADDLALQERPHAFDPIRVDRVVADILASRVVDRVVVVVLPQPREGAIFVRHDGRALGDVGAHLALNGAGLLVGNVDRAKLAVALLDAEQDFLASAALRTALAVHGVLVLLFAANERRVSLDRPLQRRVERLRAGRVTKAMQHEPRRLLRDLQILGERGAGDALRVVRDEPDRHKPLAEWQLGILKDRADLDREARLAVAALEGLAIREVIDAVALAVGAKLAVAPADRAQMVNAGLLVRERRHQVKQAVDARDHVRPLYGAVIPHSAGWVKQVYRSQKN